MKQYYQVSDDGAPFKCVECGERDNKPKIHIIGVFGVFHLDCVDSDWLNEAEEISEPQA